MSPSQKKEDQKIGVGAKSSQTVAWLPIVYVCATLLSVIAVKYVSGYFSNPYNLSSEILEKLGYEGLMLFKSHDADQDGFLSPEEFIPLTSRLINTNDTSEYEDTIVDTDEVLTVQAFFKPLDISTLSKDMDQTRSALDELFHLKQWLAPHRPWQNFGASDFALLLPDYQNFQSTLGDVYWLFSLPELDIQPELMFSSNRYIPPKLTDKKEILIHRLLSMFHRRPYLWTRFGPHGGVACVRAYSKDLVEIQFRIHAEFQLNEAPFFPFWFTPAHLSGYIIMTRNGSSVLDFHLSVPNNRPLNVDMEWIVGHSGDMEVDIGFMPQMELKSAGKSIPISQLDEDKSSEDDKDRDSEIIDTFDKRYKFVEQGEKFEEQITWMQEISREDASEKLEKVLYPFKEVPYYSIQEALHRAATGGLLIHGLILWGSLDDQSC